MVRSGPAYRSPADSTSGRGATLKLVKGVRDRNYKNRPPDRDSRTRRRRSSSRMSPDPILPGLFLPCSLPRLLSAAAGGGLEPAPVKRFRGASPHRLLSYAKQSPVADSFAHGTRRVGPGDFTPSPSQIRT